MRSKLLHEVDGKRTFAVILDTGDEAIGCLEAFARENAISGAQITAIGAFRSARLAYFDWETKAYQPIPVDEQAEVASLVGDIATGPNGAPSVPPTRCSVAATARRVPDTWRRAKFDRPSRSSSRSRLRISAR